MSARVFYWDASAIVSLLVPDRFSGDAVRLAHGDAKHYVSSLTCAEVYSTLHRGERNGAVSRETVEAARNAFETGLFGWSHIVPHRKLISGLARKWSLKGADLWHLAAVLTLREEQPAIALLTFDDALLEAARGENVATR